MELFASNTYLCVCTHMVTYFEVILSEEEQQNVLSHPDVCLLVLLLLSKQVQTCREPDTAKECVQCSDGLTGV